MLREMSGSDRTSLFETSIYFAARARGPEPDLAALAEAVDFVVEQLSSTSDVAVNRGAHHQKRLWPSTLPLARDLAHYSLHLCDSERRGLRAAGRHELWKPDRGAVRVLIPRQDA